MIMRPKLSAHPGVDLRLELTFRDYLTRRMDKPRFANARSVRNALEQARFRQANRLVAAAGPVGKDDLVCEGSE